MQGWRRVPAEICHYFGAVPSQSSSVWLKNECGRKGLDLTPPPGAHRGCSQMERGWRGNQLGLGLVGRWMGTVCCVSIRARASRLEARDGCQRCHPVRQSWFQTHPSLQSKQMGALTIRHQIQGQIVQAVPLWDASRRFQPLLGFGLHRVRLGKDLWEQPGVGAAVF